MSETRMTPEERAEALLSTLAEPWETDEPWRVLVGLAAAAIASAEDDALERAAREAEAFGRDAVAEVGAVADRIRSLKSGSAKADEARRNEWLERLTREGGP